MKFLIALTVGLLVTIQADKIHAAPLNQSELSTCYAVLNKIGDTNNANKFFNHVSFGSKLYELPLAVDKVENLSRTKISHLAKQCNILIRYL